MKTSVCCLVLSIFSIALPSCDSPELVRKRDKQALEISRLKGELELTEEKLKTIPADRSEELADIESESKVRQEELAKLEAEVADLEAKKQAIEKEFEDYKRKYEIR